MADTNLDTLLAAARRRDRLSDQVWPAAAAAIQLLWWHGRFIDAYVLAYETLRDLAPNPGRLLDQDVPFDEALVIGATHSGQVPMTVLAGARDLLPADSVLSKRLVWLGGNLPGRAPHELVRGATVNLKPKPLRRADAELAEHDLRELTINERQRLWQAAASRHHDELGHRLLAAGEPPHRWPTAVWMAGHLIDSGKIREASDLLIATLPARAPYAVWDITPAGFVLQPRFHPCLTPSLRNAVLQAVDIAAVPGLVMTSALE